MVCLIEYRGESKIRLQTFCLSDFQTHHPLRLFLSHNNYIQLQRRSNKFHGLTIKAKRILGLKPVQIQVQIIITYENRSRKISFRVNRKKKP